jgi:hypothetical protein
MEVSMIKKNDLVLVGIVLALCLLILAFFQLTKEEGSRVIVTIDGKLYETFSLDSDTSFTIQGENGSYNTFVIKDGYVDMTDASCPDKICVKHKRIHYNHETITCLPNKVVLEITNGQENQVDIIAN